MLHWINFRPYQAGYFETAIMLYYLESTLHPHQINSVAIVNLLIQPIIPDFTFPKCFGQINYKQ